ncbi:MAG TPA: TolC family protein [Gemmatimonadales bacterium]|jgi:cobalt-zinc-cadmium efflux system outer membrane protein|nr:TolC family protein [Gemmatimonadales bacterium]
MARHRLLLLGLATCAAVRAAAAQQPVTRAQAVTAALERGTRAALGRADTAAAAGVLHSARLYPNPGVSASYSKDVPHYHVLADVPLDLPWLRGARVGAARSAADAARYGFAFERAAIRFDVDTIYTRALAAQAHARLSRHNASDADSLRRIAELRRSVGDVSELDVRLAEVNAGQLLNVAADDSLAAVEALLAVQLAMGLGADEGAITLADTLAPPPDSLAQAGSAAAAGEPLPVAAARASLEAQQRTLTLAHRNVFEAPRFQVGFDNGDPGGQPGLLPTFGLAITLPLFNQNGGAVAEARAARDRAAATFDQARRETAAARARAVRSSGVALARLARDRRLLASADRVAAMSLRAYGEGAVPVASVLEAQRNAREALGRYIDDLAAANDAAAAVHLFAAAAEAP